MSAPPTIHALKQNFIEEQVRLLSKPLAPSRAWLRGNNPTARAAGRNSTGGAADAVQGHLPQKAVDDALLRLNQRLQQHTIRVYHPAGTRHVAEQLEALYLSQREAGQATGDGDEGHGDNGWLTCADFADAQTIAALPAEWPSAEDAESQPMEARRFAELSENLKNLSARREQLETRVARLRALDQGLAPFRSTTTTAGVDDQYNNNPAAGVQRNLATKGSEVERELERMRFLMARVGDGVARLLEDEARRKAATVEEGLMDDSVDSLFREVDESDLVDLEGDAKRKVADLLEQF